ncbi:Mediator of RNA polymerase II transcription subunit 1 [Halotydeus destructor]|nr:Mediator of RNA polymerase II transcription subunit 1 [Halotydeus destructor]
MQSTVPPEVYSTIKPSVNFTEDGTSSGTSAIVLDNLMEKIRNRANQFKVWPELIKLSKTAMLDKRGLIGDPNERNQLEKCLDTIQKNIKITGLQSMIERLETITRQMGLKFTAGPTGKDVFISSDMFYVEVVLEPSTGHVKDVKIAHQAEPESCAELIRVLRNGDFIEFTKHLEGLCSIYQLNCDKKQKSKAYTALHCMENDLMKLAQVQSIHLNDANYYIHKTPVGLLENRKGGHSMKLTYFVSPYDLLDRKSKKSVPLTLEVVMEKKLGYSVVVCIESSEKTWKLQNQNLINLAHGKDGKPMPSCSALSNLNSSALPAYFVLRLPKAVAMSLDIIRNIGHITGIDWAPHEALSKAESLVSLIAKQILPEKEKIGSNNNVLLNLCGPFFVKLPDQEHCYHVNNDYCPLEGIPVSVIPFLHPSHVPQILVLLRQQVMFNVVIGSCIRKISPFNLSDTQLSFEVTAMSTASVSVSFEHPVEESLATLEVDLADITNVKCKLYNASSFANLCSDEYVSKVMQKSLSIPITLRQVIVKCQEKASALREEQIKHQHQLNNKVNQNDMFNIQNSINNYNNSNNNSGISNYLSQQLLANQFRQNSTAASDTNAVTQMNAQQQLTAAISQLQQQQKMQQRMTGQSAPQQQRQLGPNSVSAQQQQQTNVQNQQQTKHNQMLMSMLSDIPAANSVLKQQQMNYLYQQQQQQQLQGSKVKKPRKRKGEVGNRSPGSSMGRSPKRKMSDDDFSRDLPTPSSEFLDNFGDPNQSLSRPPSTASSSTPSYDPHTPRSFEHMLGKTDSRIGGSVPGGGDESANLIANYQYQLSRSISLPSDAGDLSLPDGILDFDFGPSVSGGVQGKAKKRSRKGSDTNDVSGSLMFNDEGSNGPLKTCSDDSNPGNEFGRMSPFAAPSSKQLAKGSRMNHNDGRRCSSAGIGEANMKRNISGSPVDNSAMKQEKKRKRAESVDSLKMAGSIALMPPPLITSSGEITSVGGFLGSASSHAFMDGPINGAPALRPITLNVKPMAPSSTVSNSNVLVAKSPSGSGRKTPNVTSSAGQSGSKLKTDNKLKVKNSEMNGVSSGAKILQKNAKNKISSSRGPTGSPTKGLLNKALKQKTGQVSSSSVPGLKLNATSPPVSSSSQPSGMTSPTMSMPGVSSSKQAPNFANANKMVAMPQKRKVALSSIIDKLKGSAQVPGPGEVGPTSGSPGLEPGRAESSVGATGRPDSSSKNPATGGKLGENKLKFSRAGGEFTVKQSAAGSGLKLSITKTKPSSSTEAKPGVKTKAPATSTGVKPASGLVKQAKVAGQMKRPGTPSYKPGSSLKPAGGVSSSSGSLMTSPKMGQPGRNPGSGKVSSSGSGAGGAFKSGKISSSSAEAILQAALPTLRIENMPKIPRTANPTPSSAVGSQVSQSSQPPPLSSPSVNTSILPQPTKRVVPRERQEAPTPSLADFRSDVSDRFQSSAITSSYAPLPASQETPTISSSGNTDDSQPPPQSSVATTLGPPGPDTVGPGPPEKGGVSSSSDMQATSTPSSPVETASVSDTLPNIPLIIPTESFEEPDQALGDNEGNHRNSGTPSIDSSETGMSGSFSAIRDNISSSSNRDQSGVSESNIRSGSATPVPSSATIDEDDEDGLVIDFTVTPSKSDCVEDVMSNSDPVSSSNARPGTSEAGPSPVSQISSHVALLEMPPTSSVNHSNDNASAPSSSSPGSDQQPDDLAQPSVVSSGPRSPYNSIDDDLMDEALVLSND